MSDNQTATAEPTISPVAAMFEAPRGTFAERLTAFAADLWWTGRPEAHVLWQDLDPKLYDDVDHNPGAMIAEGALDRMPKGWKARAETLMAQHAARLAAPFRTDVPRTAYMCMEYGLHESVPIYSGGLGMLAGMMPGMKKAKAAMQASGMDDKVLVHMDAIIGSMTPKERGNPALLNAKRKKRVAAGSGTQVQDVNKVLKMHQEMSRAMKQIKKMGGMKGLAAMLGGGGGMGGLPGMGGKGGSLPGMDGQGMGDVDMSKLPPDLQKLLPKK